MTSYVQKKSRVFRAAGEPQPLLPKRSEARLKRYPSATDARAWTLDNEDRRQHILEMLLQKSASMNLGKFIPLEVLINTLLANKDADIERLKKQLEELQRLLDELEKLLTPEQKRELDKLKGKLDTVSESVHSRSSRSSRSSKRSRTSDKTSDGGDIGESTTTAEKPDSSSLTDSVKRGFSVDDTTDDDEQCAADQPAVAACDITSKDVLQGSSPDELREIIKERDKEICDLKQALAALQADCDQHKAITQSAVEQLEGLGDIVEERDNLKSDLDDSQQKLETLLAQQEQASKADGDMEALKNKAREADDLQQKNNALENELAAMKAKLGDDIATTRTEMDAAKKQIICKCREVDTLRVERDNLRRKLSECEAKEQEMERLRYRVKETEVLRIERDRMKMRLDELSNIEMEFMDLLDKTKGFDSIKAERDMFKAKYEEMCCIECEVEMLRSQLDSSKNVTDEKNALQRQVCDLECCLADQECEINRLVEHIESLAQGRDDQQSLVFEELEYMHTKVCDATAKLLNNQSGGPVVEPSETDKYLLMKRNMSLENDLAGKQMQCKTTVARLEMDIQSERHRLEDLRKLLEREKNTNNELLRRLKMQTKAVSNMQMEREMLRRRGSVHEEKLHRYIAAIEQEKVRVKELETELDNEKVNVRRLKDILNLERKASRSNKSKDCELENLRQELERSLNSEMMLRMELEQRYPPHTASTGCSARRQMTPIHPNSTSFYTELKSGDKSCQPRCQFMKQQTPNKEYED